jgi:ATP-dependent helicase Lhr and Lhr-like helicase
VLAWPKREGLAGRPARVAGAYVVLVEDEPVLYLERGGRGLLRLTGPSVRDGAGACPGAREGAREADPVREAMQALADAVRAGRVGKLALERIDGEPAIASQLAETLLELGFHCGPRRLTLSA